MNLSATRLLIIVAGLTVAAFVIAFSVRHATHGSALALGDVAWPTFLISALATALIALATITKRARARRSTRPANR
jgi:hypothetical protein